MRVCRHTEGGEQMIELAGRLRRAGAAGLTMACLMAVGVAPAGAADADAGGAPESRAGAFAAASAAARADGDAEGPRPLLRPTPPLTEGATLQEQRCFGDQEGDVVDNDTGAPAVSPEADIVEHCVNYAADLTLTLDVVAPTDPFTDPAWDGFTGVSWLIDTDGDDGFDFSVGYIRSGGEVIVSVLDAAGAEVCSGTPLFSGGYIASGIEASCIGAPASIAVAPAMFYEDAGSVFADFAPNDAPFESPVDGGGDTEPPPEPPPSTLQCPGAPGAIDETGEVVVLRVACGNAGESTNMFDQAVAMSEATFTDGQAFHGIIAGDRAFADALAGSALSFGFAPILYSSSAPDAGLAPQTRIELQRVLTQGSTVYLLGGPVALPPGLEAELQALGYNPVRLQGETRYHTAAAISAEARLVLESFRSGTDFPDLRTVMVATGENWPDAVAAGQLAAYWGFPVLLTQRSLLPDVTIQAIRAIDPEYIYVVGGPTVIERDPVLVPLRELTQRRSGPPCATDGGEFWTCRFFGATRSGTATSIAELNRRLLRDNINSISPPDAEVAVAVNLRREPDGWAHVLSAAPLVGNFGSVYIPIEGQIGDFVPDEARRYLCEFVPSQGFDNPTILVVAGDRDLIAEGTSQELDRLLEGGC